MTESQEQLVERLQAELAAAKIAQLQQQYGQQGQPARLPAGIFEPHAQVFTAGQVPPGIQELLASRGGNMDALAGMLGSMFGTRVKGPGGPVGYGTPGGDEPLSPAPRSIPLALRFCLFQWRWWEAFTMMMVIAAPIALWFTIPESIPAGAILILLVMWILRARGIRNRTRLLKWGMPAAVNNVEVQRVGSYSGGMTYNNMRVAVARGWKVERSFYSRPATTTKIRYALGGQDNDLTLRGLAYEGGVILADVRKPSKALCVNAYPFDLARDATGDWLPELKSSAWIGSLFAILLHVGWLIGIAILVQHTWLV